MIALRRDLSVGALMNSNRDGARLSRQNVTMFINMYFLVGIASFAIAVRIFRSGIAQYIMNVSLVKYVMRLVPTLRRAQVDFVCVRRIMERIRRGPPAIRVIAPFLRLVCIVEDICVSTMFRFTGAKLPIRVRFGATIARINRVSVQYQVANWWQECTKAAGRANNRAIMPIRFHDRSIIRRSWIRACVSSANFFPEGILIGRLVNARSNYGAIISGGVVNDSRYFFLFMASCSKIVAREAMEDARLNVASYFLRQNRRNFFQGAPACDD